MKFGHAFQEALEADSYPPHWVEKAVPYRQLKKILATVREELIKNGYDPGTLHRLLADHNAEYRLETDASHLLRPELVVRPSISGPSLEAATEPRGPPAEVEVAPSEPDGADDCQPRPDHDHEWVRIPLDSDARFFSVLQTDVGELDTLQEGERRSLNDRIHALGTEVSDVARPRKGFVKLSKSDLYRWREIFELYLAAQVFFSTSELAGGPRDSERARKQLVWFQDEVNRRQLPQQFKIESSVVAYSHFLDVNAKLLHNLRFQELNRTAVTKIIKSKCKGLIRSSVSLPREPSANLRLEFDKRTSLGIKTTFPMALYPVHFISESISKDICAQLALEVVSLVPQVVDYTCTVCKCSGESGNIKLSGTANVLVT